MWKGSQTIAEKTGLGRASSTKGKRLLSPQ
jgi:hypothetical protein